MSEIEVKSTILELKNDIVDLVNQNIDCRYFLENIAGKNDEYIERYSSLWEYAFENVNEWDKVKIQFGILF